eukprot:SAG11_NODE_3095_length_2699_cov_23.700769_2_plen_603_part_00
MRDLPFDMDGFRNYMEQQTEALQMAFALYTAVTDLGEEDIARQWTQAVVSGQGGIDTDRLAAAIISVNNRYATHQEMIRAAVEVYHRHLGPEFCEEPVAAEPEPETEPQPKGNIDVQIRAAQRLVDLKEVQQKIAAMEYILQFEEDEDILNDLTVLYCDELQLLGDDCPICLLPMREPMATTSCGHQYHFDCLRNAYNTRRVQSSWSECMVNLQTWSQCPMCREQYNYITFGGVSLLPNALEAVPEQARAPAPAQAAAAEPEPEAEPEPAPAPAPAPAPFVLHSEDQAQQWLINTAANNGTYSALYVPFIHAVLQTGHLQPQIAIWRRIFGAERWDDFVARYRYVNTDFNPHFGGFWTATGYVDAPGQDHFLLQGGQQLQQEFMMMVTQVTAQIQQPAAAAAPPAAEPEPEPAAEAAQPPVAFKIFIERIYNMWTCSLREATSDRRYRSGYRYVETHKFFASEEAARAFATRATAEPAAAAPNPAAPAPPVAYDRDVFAEIQRDYGHEMTAQEYADDDSDYSACSWDISACHYCARGEIDEQYEGQGVGDVFEEDDWICRRCFRFFDRAGLPSVSGREDEDYEARSNWLANSGIPNPNPQVD